MQGSRLLAFVFLSLTSAPLALLSPQYYWLSNGAYCMASIIQVWSSSPIDPKAMLNVLAFCVVVGKILVQLVQSAGGLGMLSAYTHRISEVSERAEEHALLNSLLLQEKHLVDNNALAMNHTGVVVGSGSAAATLVADLSFKVPPGDSVLIMGASACGKSSVHRLLAGLWTLGSDPRATVSHPSVDGRGGLFFVPQSNYATEGSLMEQVIYPHRASECRVPDSELESILAQVGLPYLVGRWTLRAQGIEWSEVLSGGEAQRLGLARVLYHSPKFACMDECTSALDLALEAECMEAVKARQITMLSIGTRVTQRRYHQRLLRLDGCGHYTLTSLQPTRASVVVPNYQPPPRASIAAIRQSNAARLAARTAPAHVSPLQVVTSSSDDASSSTPWQGDEDESQPFIDVDDPEINELVVTASSIASSRMTMSLRPAPFQ
jgi:ABC-type uncharacterized transport system fused permease/ATPase subunit